MMQHFLLIKILTNKKCFIIFYLAELRYKVRKVNQLYPLLNREEKKNK